GVAFVDHGGTELARTFESQHGHVVAPPTFTGFQVQLAWPVDADFSDIAGIHVLPDPQQAVLVVQEIPGRDCGDDGRTHGIHCRNTEEKSTSRATYTFTIAPWLMVTVGGRAMFWSSAMLASRSIVRAVLLSYGLCTTTPLAIAVSCGPCLAPAYLNASLSTLISKADPIRCPQ